MAVVNRLFLHLSIESLKTYCEFRHFSIDQMDWSQKRSLFKKELIDLLSHYSDLVQTQIHYDAERISVMADEVGEAAMDSLQIQEEAFNRLTSSWEKALWLLMNDPKRLRQAEDIRYSDHNRRGRDWDGYEIESELGLNFDESSITQFRDELKQHFTISDNLLIDHFVRQQKNKHNTDETIVQFMIYQEGAPNNYLAFEDQGQLVTRMRRPVAEHAITYSPTSGALEVVASKQSNRTFLATTFHRTLLQQPEDAESTPLLRQYNLMPLLQSETLDWDEKDGIESVTLVMLKLRDLEHSGRLQIDVKERSDQTLYEYANEYFGELNPIVSEHFEPIQAKINIRFYPSKGYTRSKVLPVIIRAPNHCNLRSRTQRECLIGEKYLKRWGILSHV